MCSPVRAVRQFCLSHLLFFSQHSLTGVRQFSPFTLVHSVRVPLGFGLGTSMFWVQFLQRHLSFVLIFLCPSSCPQYLSLGNESILTTAGCQQFAGRQLCNSQVCSKKNECQQMWHPVFLLVAVCFLRQYWSSEWLQLAHAAGHGNVATSVVQTTWFAFLGYEIPHIVTHFSSIFTGFVTVNVYTLFCKSPCAVIL